MHWNFDTLHYMCDCGGITRCSITNSSKEDFHYTCENCNKTYHDYNRWQSLYAKYPLEEYAKILSALQK